MSTAETMPRFTSQEVARNAGYTLAPDGTALRLIRTVTLPGYRVPEAWAGGCVVYFVQFGEGEPIKIGVTNNLQSRMAALGCAHWLPPRVLLAAPGAESAEDYVHRRFAQHRIAIGREWFRPDQEIFDYIDLAYMLATAGADR